MAKDAQGHGSESRGGYQNIDKNLRGPGKHVGYGLGDVWRISNNGGGYRAVGQKSGTSFGAPTLREVSATLAQNHPKSVPVDIHPGTPPRPAVGKFEFEHIIKGNPIR